MPEPTEITALRGRLEADAVNADLRDRGLSRVSVRVLSTVDSTNAELARAARGGAPEGLAIIAEEQTHGRGRLDRGWISPRGAGLTVSMLLRPGPAPGTWGWLPILAGVALAEAVRALSEVDVALKWPNDLLLGPDRAKGAGILAESGDGFVVLGVGVNVSTTGHELPAGATSLLAQGALVSRAALLVELMGALESAYAAWAAANGDAVRSGLLDTYRQRCTTIGRPVTVLLPHGEELHGTAEAIDFSGGLSVRSVDGSLATVVAGDVVHVRTGT